MYEDIKKNKIKTGIIVSIFIIMITLIVYYICYAFKLGFISIIIALLFSITSAFAAYYNCDKIVLKTYHARPATKEEFLKLNNILDSLILSAGLQNRPGLYVVDSNQENAFATGRSPEQAVICVTTGLLNRLDYYELEGVIAHELAHIKNYDIRLSAVISVMAGFIIILSDFFVRSFFRPSKRDNDSNSKVNSILMIVGFIFLIISPIVSKLIQLAVSRRREFLADSTAIQFTRNPDGLISALQKISADKEPLEYASNASSHMMIANPFKNKKSSNIFSTHPSIDDRIKALQNLK